MFFIEKKTFVSHPEQRETIPRSSPKVRSIVETDNWDNIPDNNRLLYIIKEVLQHWPNEKIVLISYQWIWISLQNLFLTTNDMRTTFLKSVIGFKIFFSTNQEYL